MPTVVFNTSYEKNSNLVITPKDLKDTFLFGVNFPSQDGLEISDEMYIQFIEAAQKDVENHLDLKLKKQLYTENKHFSYSDWIRWGYIKCNYQVVCPVSLEGFLNSTKQITYPADWLMSKSTSDGHYHRNVYMVPAGSNTGHAEAVVFTGLIPQLNLVANAHIPYYWTIKYITGFDVIPQDILNVIGMLASINILHIAGDLVLGAGISSYSLGIDGLSQSVSSTASSSSGAYGARITGYTKELEVKLQKLRDIYKGFSFGVA